MIPRRRLFERQEAFRDAKSLYIFCEGKKTEPQYFWYFKEIDSRINIQIIAPEETENNSPTGLYKKAERLLIKSAENPNSTIELLPNDEVWFVIDTDKWGDKIGELRQLCLVQDWHVVQSNPCFEVWLYYHKQDIFPNFEGMEFAQNWKSFVNHIFKGGFNSSKHPIHISTAIKNAKTNYKEIDVSPHIGCTQVYQLGESIYQLVKEKLDEGHIKILENEL